jgi:hypothetical protein
LHRCFGGKTQADDNLMRVCAHESAGEGSGAELSGHAGRIERYHRGDACVDGRRESYGVHHGRWPIRRNIYRSALFRAQVRFAVKSPASITTSPRSCR